MKIIAWAVVWKKKDMARFNVQSRDKIICLDPRESFRVSCECPEHQGWHYGTSLAIFESKAEAEAWRRADGSMAFVVRPVMVEVET